MLGEHRRAQPFIKFFLFDIQSLLVDAFVKSIEKRSKDRYGGEEIAKTLRVLYFNMC